MAYFCLAITLLSGLLLIVGYHSGTMSLTVISFARISLISHTVI